MDDDDHENMPELIVDESHKDTDHIDYILERAGVSYQVLDTIGGANPTAMYVNWKMAAEKKSGAKRNREQTYERRRDLGRQYGDNVQLQQTWGYLFKWKRRRAQLLGGQGQGPDAQPRETKKAGAWNPLRPSSFQVPGEKTNVPLHPSVLVDHFNTSFGSIDALDEGENEQGKQCIIQTAPDRTVPRMQLRDVLGCLKCLHNACVEDVFDGVHWQSLLLALNRIVDKTKMIAMKSELVLQLRGDLDGHPVAIIHSYRPAGVQSEGSDVGEMRAA